MLVFVDYDGTIADKSGVSDKTKKAIYNFSKLNNEVILTTGMPRYIAKKLIQNIDIRFLVSSNGSDIFDCKNEKVIYENFVGKREIEIIYRYCFENDLKILLLSQDKEYSNYETDIIEIERLSDNLEKALETLTNVKIKQVMVSSKTNDRSEMLNAKKYILKLKDVDVLNDGTDKPKCWASFGNKNISKGNALMFLTKYLNEDIENTVAIGNDYNDISMFNVANVSVAVENATEDIKKMADKVIPSYTEDGFANFLNEVVYGN